MRYSVDSRQREQSFTARADAEAFQLRLSTGKLAEGKLFTDPKAGDAKFLPLCDEYIGKMSRAGENTKRLYRSHMRNAKVARVLQDKTVRQAAVMDDEVTTLLNVALGSCSGPYRSAIRRIITGTLDMCVRKGMISRHTLSGIELAPRVVTAEQFEEEAEAKALVFVTDDTVAMLSRGFTAAVHAGPGGRRRLVAMPGLGIAPWLQRTMGLRIREALGARKSDFRTRPDGTRYLHLCWQATRDGRGLEPLKHRRAGDFRDIPVPPMIWDMIQALPDGPLCPGRGTPYLGYATAAGRFAKITAHLGITGARTHSLRHQFASEALQDDPRELANISQVLGHESVETTLRAYIHASADAEQRIGAMMRDRWPAAPAAPAARPPGAAPAAEAA